MHTQMFCSILFCSGLVWSILFYSKVVFLLGFNQKYDEDLKEHHEVVQHCTELLRQLR